MSGHVGDLSASQQEALNQMKELVDTKLDEIQKKQFDMEYRPDLVDATILRFLRARDFKVDLSFPLLANCLTWRATYNDTGVLNISEDSIQRQMATNKAFFHGTDKKGRPLAYVRSRMHDHNTSDFEELQRYCVYTIEGCMKQLVPPHESCSVIFDLSGVGLKNLDSKFQKYFTDLFEKCYPERLGTCIVLNAPWIFWGFWKVVSGFLPTETAKKILFLNKEQLLEHVDKEVLLAPYGGDDHTYDHLYEKSK
eukprot:TRINITY_DN3373_c0_g1_i1.p1 TRINITY_DN3373_c0_g1~~TRINITY_DN3373_c0_g1_i1.p1  ORF type:complete len:262 (+),score=77.06 TRINITY_DN3373_c0_g1_i1:33-788(+)